MEGYPAVFVIGADGTLHPQMHMPNYGAGGYDTKEVRDELDKLLQDVYESKRARKKK